MSRRTLFLDVNAMAVLVGRVGLRPLLREVVGAMRSDYLRWDEFEKSPRTANHSELGVIELMPVSDRELYSFKYVNGHPANPAGGLSTVMAFGALAEVRTGFPLLLSEMTLLTAIRTAAASVLAAKSMARPGSRTMAMIGNGAQSEFQIVAFHEMLGITRHVLFDTDLRATEKLVRNLSGLPGLELIVAASAAEAAREADIVTTCTADKVVATILHPRDVRPGTHLNAIGGDCPGKTELDPDLVRAARVVVEYAPQSRIEGEIQRMAPDFPVIELHEVLRGSRCGRETDEEVTLFDSVGFGLEDFSALRVVHAAAERAGIGTRTELVPTEGDVKDLWRLLPRA